MNHKIFPVQPIFYLLQYDGVVMMFSVVFFVLLDSGGPTWTGLGSVEAHGKPRPHQQASDMLVVRPKIRQIPEAMSCQIRLFIFCFGPLPRRGHKA